MITKRDSAVISFLQEFKAADTETLASLFYPSACVARRRLASLCDLGQINRERGSVSLQYVYFIKRPGNLRHAVLASQFVAKFSKSHKIINVSREPNLGGIRPDLQINYLDGESEQVSLVEIEISNKGLDNEKYRRWEVAERHRLFHVKPKRIVVTDKSFIKASKEYELIRI